MALKPISYTQKLACNVHTHVLNAQKYLADQKGQGTTEYAILVGILVVIAIVAITLFRPKIEELWNAIAEGINSL